jgi:Sec-independent protein translocase protein TatA
LLDRVSVQRTRLERSFTTAMRELKQLQKERQTQLQQEQPIETTKTAEAAPAPAHKSAGPQAPRPDYVMSEGQEAHPVFCSPITPDTR